MMRYANPRLSSALVLAALLAGCDNQPTEPRADARPDFGIVDGARGGNAQFFFLPPMVPAPTYSGTFDGTRSPVVSICELTGAVCGATIASFSGAQVKVDLKAEAYQANWKTKDSGLDPSTAYRIQVLVGTEVLGYADVVLLSNGSQIRTVDRDQFVATINGGTLPIRFRIETGAVPPPPPGPWQNGEVITHIQAVWGDPTSSAGQLVATQYNSVYAAAAGVLEVGLVGASGFSIAFTSGLGVLGYLPAVGSVGPLNADLVDPTSTSSGAFGGEVVGLALNIDFSAAGHTLGTSGIPFGDLTLCNLATLTALNGLDVNDFFAIASSALGGGAAPYTILELHLIAEQLNAAFSGGGVSTFAQDHLVNGACPPAGPWQNGEVITSPQASWGDPASSAGLELAAHFNTVYGAAGSQLEVGVLGAAGFSMLFTTALAVLNYLPAVGPPEALAADLVNPGTSASGAFGGEVVGLHLNVDFSDAGHTAGSSGLRFGDLTLCNFTTLGTLNDLTVRDFLAISNSALAGDAAPYTIIELHTVAEQLNFSFAGGTASQFARDHLVNGACLPAGPWQNGEVITYLQGTWGDPVSPAGVLLIAHYDLIYAFCAPEHRHRPTEEKGKDSSSTSPERTHERDERLHDHRRVARLLRRLGRGLPHLPPDPAHARAGGQAWSRWWPPSRVHRRPGGGLGFPALRPE